MQNLKKRFQLFHKSFPFLNIQEQIENFAVFDGSDFKNLQLSTDIIENIKINILNDIDKLRETFTQNEDIKKILYKLAIGDRKQYAVYKHNQISQQKGKYLYKELYTKNIITKEQTREKLPKSSKHRPLKKEYRGYVAENKLKFTKNFHRFWYTFIALRQDKIVNLDLVEEDIKNNLDKFISLTFEELSNELIKQDIFGLNIVETGGYWDKHVEIDILSKDVDGNYIIGECKWTNQKICKNVLRKLQNKAKLIDFQVTKYALFSKNGFSNSFQKENSKEILLFDIDKFKRLNDD
ncbi:MAG: DUF234 domain-containing protein [Epsilonproteobacteria bacterium]|nr:DUF234 domain-containing protein [Campylobacterota bacterium]